jgi:hypothetical protein
MKNLQFTWRAILFPHLCGAHFTKEEETGRYANSERLRWTYQWHDKPKEVRTFGFASTEVESEQLPARTAWDINATKAKRRLSCSKTP